MRTYEGMFISNIHSIINLRFEVHILKRTLKMVISEVPLAEI